MSLPCANNHEFHLYKINYLSRDSIDDDATRKPRFIITGNCERVLETPRKQPKIIIVPILTLLVSMSSASQGDAEASQSLAYVWDIRLISHHHYGPSSLFRPGFPCRPGCCIVHIVIQTRTRRFRRNVRIKRFISPSVANRH